MNALMFFFEFSPNASITNLTATIPHLNVFYWTIFGLTVASSLNLVYLCNAVHKERLLTGKNRTETAIESTREKVNDRNIKTPNTAPNNTKPGHKQNKMHIFLSDAQRKLNLNNSSTSMNEDAYSFLHSAIKQNEHKCIHRTRGRRKGNSLHQA